MDLAESLERWKKRYSSVVQEGKLSRDDAERKLRLGEKNLGRAKRNLEVDPDEPLINAETAIVNAADAVLAAGGFRVPRQDWIARGAARLSASARRVPATGGSPCPSQGPAKQGDV